MKAGFAQEAPMAVVIVSVCLMLIACKPRPSPNDLPVSYWADPKSIGADGLGYADECSVISAQAILKSGLMFPNFGVRNEIDKDGVTVRKRIKTVDYWIGGQRFVFPAELAVSGNYPLHNPHRYKALAGTLPNFYPKGPSAPLRDGMAPMVDVQFICSTEKNFTDKWGEGFQSNESGISAAVARYEASSKSAAPTNRTRQEITVASRDDLQMTEVLYDRGGIYSDGQPMWEASYWPMRRELRDGSGGVNGISCQSRNDPEKTKRYGGRAWRCTSVMSITPYVAATIGIYVSHLEHMPTVYDQVQNVINNAKLAGEAR